jgi:SAM-dependent methyltransferase
MAKKTWATANILDVGCGKELPMAKMLYSMKMKPARYLGIDAGRVKDEAKQVFHTGSWPLELKEQCAFGQVDIEEDAESFDLITSFEVLEHVEPELMHKMLDEMMRLIKPTGSIFISTPCWDRKSCAGNHVNEMRYEALGAVFEEHGFAIEAVHGTFASIRDYQHLLDEHEIQVFKRLREYYDTNFLSCVLAPLYPQGSRNALWELSPIQGDNYEKQFPNGFRDEERPWGSSENWADMKIN